MRDFAVESAVRHPGRLVAALAVSVGALLQPAPAARAHPHVFIDAEAGFGFDAKGRLAAVHVVWRYDAFASLFLLEEMKLDPDGDGALTDAERAALADDQLNWPETFEGDSVLYLDGARVALGRAVGGTADVEDGRIVVRFRRDLAEPVAPGDREAVLRLYDPTYFFAYAIAPTPILRDAPEGCAASVKQFDPYGAASSLLAELAQLGREETPADPEIGAQFSDEVRLTCG